jgi:hypothetical protein
MSDTPRTDDATYYTHLTEEGLGGEPVVPVCFAEELERELAAMTAERDALKESIRGALICAKNKKMRVTEQERLDMVAALLTRRNHE